MLYSDIKIKNVDKINYKRIEYSPFINWCKIFPSSFSDNYYNTTTIKVPVKKGVSKYTNRYPITFDIETNPDGTSWVQQFTINKTTIICHNWDDTMNVFEIIKSEMENIQIKDVYAIATICIANLSFEFQYLRKRLDDYVNVFATRKRKPLYVTTKRLHFIDPLRLSNSSLEKLSELYNLPTKKAFEMVNGKKIMDLDYSKYRTSKWVLSDKEKEYVCNDVEILADFYNWCIINYIDNGVDIPATATGIDRDTINQLAREELTEIKMVTDKKTGKQKKRRFPTNLGKRIAKLFPETKREYDDLMMYTFVGGYTKSNFLYTGVELTNVNGVDFTSSYPSVMMFDKFPMYPFRDDQNLKDAVLPNGKILKGTTIDDIIIQGKNGLASIQKIRFYELEAITTHSIQSASKCYEYTECDKKVSDMIEKYHCIIDNGRIFYSKQLTVSLTELDIETFKEFYTWKRYEIIERKISCKDYLPDYIRKTVIIYYQFKAVLKKQGLDGTTEYQIAKAMVNALYGMMCEKLHIEQDVVNPYNKDDVWQKSIQLVDTDYLYAFSTMGISGDFENPEKFENAVKRMERIYKGTELTNKFLSPYWAVYTTAYARRNLLKNVFKAREEVIYCDTDSMYFIDNGISRQIMKDWNDEIHKRNTKLINEWNIKQKFDRKLYDAENDVEIKEKYLHDTHGILLENLIDLGEFDMINPYANYSRFKTLGCKRYLKTGLTKDKQTGELIEMTTAVIAGLPKKALLDYAKEINNDPYEIFNHGMSIPNCKKAHEYIDDEYSTTVTDEQGNTEVMHELSAVRIYDIDFSMKLSEQYVMLLSMVKDDMRYSITERYNKISEEIIDKFKEMRGYCND